MHCFVRWVAGCLGALACLHLGAGAAQAERRVALVVGNASYGHHPKLPNVPNDAAAMATLFKAAKFDVVETKQNLGVAELRRALREFSGQAAGADMAVLYFAGHGIEVDRTNYLIPVDAKLAADIDVEDETVSLDRVLQLLEPAKRLRLVILDACRENPFAGSIKRTVVTRSVGRGLGRVEPAISNTLIAFATRANAVAEDGKGANSPFTAALAKHLTAPGLDLRIALGHVRDEVLASTANKQEPYFTGSLGGGMFSLVGAVQATGQPQPGATALEWARVDKASVAELETFERPHPTSVEAEYARARIKDLRKVAIVSPPAPPVAPRPEPAVAFNPSRAAAPLTAAEERALKPQDSFKECADCPEMVVVPAGSFTMGSPDSEPERLSWEGPQRRVTFARPFAVGKFEVTFAEWDVCRNAGGCRPWSEDSGWGRGKRPVINVSWDDITKEYLPWLSRKTGKTYRLLTEAEWEYVARAGTSTPFWWGSSISIGQANYDGNYTYGGASKGEHRKKTVPVDSFAANPWGLYNVHGNVWEWVQDCWNDSYNGAPADGSAWTTGDCSSRVLRGGSWVNGPRDLRSASRYRYSTPAYPLSNFGFRVGRTLAP